jgi:hypothetical protein
MCAYAAHRIPLSTDIVIRRQLASAKPFSWQTFQLTWRVRMPEVFDKIKDTTNKQRVCSRARDKFITRRRTRESDRTDLTNC